MKQNVDQIFPKYETECGSFKAHQWFPVVSRGYQCAQRIFTRAITPTEAKLLGNSYGSFKPWGLF